MVEQEQSQKTQQTYFVAVDGSEASDLAFSVAMDGLFRNGQDKFYVATVTDSKKEHLPFNFRPEFIEEKYTAKIYAMANQGVGQFYKRECDHVANKTTKDQLYELANELKSTIMVCGNHGRKGPKEEDTYLGSTTKYLASSGTMPVVIIKDARTRREEAGKSYRFGVCFDTSRHSQKTLRTVCSMMQDHDKLMTITVAQEGIDQKVADQQVDKIAAEFGISAEKVTLEMDDCPNAYTRVQRYLVEESTDEKYVDFVGVGNRGVHKRDEDKATLGSMAEIMITDRHLNVIFVPCE